MLRDRELLRKRPKVRLEELVVCNQLVEKKKSIDFRKHGHNSQEKSISGIVECGMFLRGVKSAGLKILHFMF